jgi:predicted RNA-binding protein with TRAM domain
MKTRIKPLIAAIALLGATTLAHAADVQIVKKLSGFETPESVLVAPDGKIYVSEIAEFGKDGDGKISVIEGGKRKLFAEGMDDPKGLAYSKGTLYVADKARILKIEKNGKWKVFAAAEAFPVKPQFLNDLTVDKAGNIYVSDSGDLKGKGGAVYRVAPDGKVSTVITGIEDKRVLAPNGLLPDGNDLLMLDFVSGNLYRIVLKTGRMAQVAEGFGGGDGIARDSKGTLWISDWKNGRLFTLKKDGELKFVKDGFKASADITIAADGKTVLVPDMKAGEVVWVR